MSQSIAAATARGLSLEEWAALDEEEAGELVDGRLVEEEMPEYIHEVIVAWFVRALGNWLVPRGGSAVGSGAKYAVAAARGRKPDASAWFPGRRPPARGLIREPPDLALEVVSATPRDAKRDRIEKMDEYAGFGVRFYWILDPAERTLEVYELGADRRYVRALGASEGILTSIPGCEGLTLDLGTLWAEVERLEQADPSDPTK
jgi:Uma2 family endonuclease